MKPGQLFMYKKNSFCIVDGVEHTHTRGELVMVLQVDDVIGCRFLTKHGICTDLYRFLERIGVMREDA